jgi:hypothetical protein
MKKTRSKKSRDTIPLKVPKREKKKNSLAFFTLSEPMANISLTLYSVHHWIFWFSPQVTYQDGIAQCNWNTNISRLGTFKPLSGPLPCWPSLRYTIYSRLILQNTLLFTRNDPNKCSPEKYLTDELMD